MRLIARKFLRLDPGRKPKTRGESVELLPNEHWPRRRRKRESQPGSAQYESCQFEPETLCGPERQLPAKTVAKQEERNGMAIFDDTIDVGCQLQVAFHEDRSPG